MAESLKTPKDSRDNTQQPASDAGRADSSSVPSTSSGLAAQDGASTAGTGKTLKTKRSALFYPSQELAAQSNARPFANSAAKRDSVQALGSIQHLQHMYSKQGLASKQNANARIGAMVPAIGLALPDQEPVIDASEARAAALAQLASGEGSGTSAKSVQLDGTQTGPLPPSPKASGYRLPPYPDVPKQVEADYRALRPEALKSLDHIRKIWLLDAGHAQGADAPVAAKVMQTTKDCIRTVRAYLVALPQDAFARVDIAHPARLARDPVRDKDQFRLSRKPSTVQLPQVSIGGGSGFLNVRRRPSSQALSSRAMEDAMHRSFSGNSEKSLNSNPPVSPTLVVTPDVPTTAAMRRSASAAEYSDRPSDFRRSISGRQPSESSLPPSSYSPLLVEEDSEEKESPASEALSRFRKMTVELLGTLHELRTQCFRELGVPTPATAKPDLLLSPDQSNAGPPPANRRLSAALSDISNSAWSEGSNQGATNEEADEQKTRLLEAYPLRQEHFAPRQSLVDDWRLTAEEVIRLTDSVIASWQPRLTVSSHEATSSPPPDQGGDTEAIPTGLAALSISDNEVRSLINAVASYLPPHKAGPLLDSSVSDEQALEILSDAYLLCLAFNAALRGSTSPWGMIQARDIHDMDSPVSPVTNSAPLKSDWTFRRVQNLQCWATSMRRRYNIVPRKAFNAMLVARKEPGWQQELLDMIHAWVEAVSEHK